MYKIVVKGQASCYYHSLHELDGIRCYDEFTQYFSKDEESLVKKNVREGYLHFEYDPLRKQLLSITSYTSDEKLTEDELKTLLDYTQGQWSDGIGESFEQSPCYENNDLEEAYISPWWSGQIATINQHKIN